MSLGVFGVQGLGFRVRWGMGLMSLVFFLA